MTLAIVGVVVAVIVASAPAAASVFFVIVTLLVCVFLLRGVRWLWILMIVLLPLGFAMEVVEGNVTWYAVALGIVSLVLLLHPDTRRFFRRGEAPAAAQGSGA